ncbi:AsmA family protein [Sphingomonas jeddahensis]|uniref:AsmA family protein n=1 Tax=Sphingomonas jeddahensis TaxID=1915074 RepID=A0A1V2ETX5_9SPHN|nr:AsmA family protein [Sphingomonas jeddahensis]ONF96132.1 AsmA family protein [Sphingomonas jeddahensis]
MIQPLANRRLRIAAIIVTAFLAVLAVALAAFPWGLLKGVIESRMTERFGRPVTIGAMERVDRFGFTTSVRLHDVRVPGPAWAGDADLALVRDMEIGFSALSLVTGRLALSHVTLSGARLHLIRARDGRENWRGSARRGGSGGGGLDRLTVHDSRLTYRDAKQDRSFDLALASNAAAGLRLNGSGTVRGTPVQVAIRAPAISDKAEGRWPFDARIAGDGLTMHAKGSMDAPLDTDRMTLDVTAQARDLKLIDAIIEAGLFRTQPVTLSAHVRREPGRWLIDRLDGRIGRSDLSGTLTVGKQDGRTKLDGTFTSRQLDFDDFASDEGLAQRTAKERATGPRVVPDTRVNLAKIGSTDGRIAFRVGRIVSREGPSSLTSLSGTLVLDHRVLTVAPLTIGVREGRITGRAVIDQRDDGPVPLVRLDFRLTDSSIPALGGGGGSVTGRVDGRAVLAGRGSTIREAVGRADGRIGLVARNGELPREIAEALGFDAGSALLARDDARAVLRCVVVGLDMRAGRGRAGPFVVDTSQSRLDGEGTVTFPGETLAIRLSGAPKHDAVLRLPGSATMGGTVSAPDIVVPREVKSVGNVFKALGRAITGRQGPVAQDADCAGLAARVLR